MVNGEVVNCEKVWHEVSSYLDGEVSPRLRAAMDDHFRTCLRCKSVLDGARNVLQLYSDERMVEVPVGFGERLEKRLARSARVQRSSTWSAWLIPVAALGLFAGGLRWANSLTVPHPLQSEHAQPANDIPPDMPVVVSAGAREFHVPGCEFIHNKEKERTLTARDAIREGYAPCVRCMRKYLQTASAAHIALEFEANAAADIDDDDMHPYVR